MYLIGFEFIELKFWPFGYSIYIGLGLYLLAYC